jgi:hypothetical protein
MLVIGELECGPYKGSFIPCLTTTCYCLIGNWKKYRKLHNPLWTYIHKTTKLVYISVSSNINLAKISRKSQEWIKIVSQKNTSEIHCCLLITYAVQNKRIKEEDTIWDHISQTVPRYPRTSQQNHRVPWNILLIRESQWLLWDPTWAIAAKFLGLK